MYTLRYSQKVTQNIWQLLKDKYRDYFRPFNLFYLFQTSFNLNVYFEAKLSLSFFPDSKADLIGSHPAPALLPCCTSTTFQGTKT